MTNPTGAYVLLVWNDPATESDSTLWTGYRIRRAIPGIDPAPLEPGRSDSLAKGEVIGQLKARDRLTKICLSSATYCDTDYNILGIGGGFFFNGFRGNRRSDGSYVIDYGALWRSVPSASSQDIRAIWGSSGAQAFAVGAAGSIQRYDGSAWNTVTSSVRANLSGISGSSAAAAFAVGDSGVVVGYDGAVWSRRTTNLTRPVNLRGVWSGPPNAAFAVGDSGVALRFDGSSWDSLASGTLAHLRGVWAASATDAFAVGDRGTVLRYNGTAWSAAALADTTNLHAVWGASAADVFAVGDGGTILRYNGIGWSAMKSGTRRTLRAVWGTSSSDVFAAGGGGEILHYDGNAGAQWTSMSSVSPGFLRGVWGSSGTDVFAVGSGGTIVRYDGTDQLLDECLRCRVFLDTGNLSGFRSRYAVTSVDTTAGEYKEFDESRVEQIVEIKPSTPPTDDLERVAVVPNPYKEAAEWDEPGRRSIHFIHLPDGATVRIFTSSLELVRRLKLDARSNPGGVTGELEWDMRNADGHEVKTGIYLYQVESAQGRTREGHFVIIK